MNVLFFVFVVQISFTKSAFVVEEGFVKYKVNAKAFFGTVTHTITAKNDSVSGNFHVSEGKLKGELVVKARYFSSGNSRRDTDISQILDVENYPVITFEPLDIDTVIVKEILKSDKGERKIKGKLTVKGNEKIYDEILMLYEKVKEDSYVFKIEINAKFTDFGISPPRIKGLGAIGKVITYAPDEIFLSGIVKINIELLK
jgi:polyisoprenoid-binding protein YceI